jgi:hypothetical protein
MLLLTWGFRKLAKVTALARIEKNRLFIDKLYAHVAAHSLQDQQVHEDALAILRAPHEMILQREDRASVDSVAIIDHD